MAYDYSSWTVYLFLCFELSWKVVTGFTVFCRGLEEIQERCRLAMVGDLEKAENDSNV